MLDVQLNIERGTKFESVIEVNINVVSKHLYQSQWPFSRQTWLGSPRNFARTHFKRFRTFDFSTPKKNFGAKISDEKFCFLPIWRAFWRATAKLMSKSASGSNFAPDRLILRSVRLNLVKNTIVAAASGGAAALKLMDLKALTRD